MVQSCGLLGFDFGSGCVGPVLIGNSGWPLLRSPEASGAEKRCLVSIFKTGLPKAPPFGGAGTKCLRGSLRQRFHQAAVGDDLLDKGREGFGLEGLAGGLVGDDAGVEVHMDLVACGDGVGGFGALHDG